jgi:hypothetical protein
MTPPASSDPPIAACDLQGFKRLRKVADLLAHLHGRNGDADGRNGVEETGTQIVI